MEIKDIFTICNAFLTSAFVLCYLYQFVYIFWVFLGKDKSMPIKSDKLNKGERARAMAALEEAFAEYEGIYLIPFSSVNGEGVDEVREILVDVAEGE